MLPFNLHLTTPLFYLLALLLFRHHASSTTLQKYKIYTVPGDNTFPEGIARQPGSPYFYVGSATTGDIFRGDVGEPELSLFINGSQYGIVGAFGMKATVFGHLFVAGGASGTVFVFDVRSETEQLLHRFSNGVKSHNDTLVKDLDIGEDGTVYVTDAVLTFVYRITPQELELPDIDLPLVVWVDLFATVGSCGDGIVVAGRPAVLLIGVFYKGEIWRADVANKEITKVEMRFGGTVGHPAGLLFRDQLLYSVNPLGVDPIGAYIEVIEIPPPYFEGRPLRNITSPLYLNGPTNAAFDRSSLDLDLLVVNFQFSNSTPPPPPVLPFTVVRVPVFIGKEGEL